MFSVIIPGRPCLTDIRAVDASPTGQPTKFAFTFPANPSFTDIVVFFLPGTVLPENTGAAIYVQLPDATTGAPQEFKFVGALANAKPSGIFSVRSPGGGNGPRHTEAEDEDEMLDEGSSNISGGAAAGAANGAVVTLGISIESADNITPQLAALEMERPRTESSQTSTALVLQTPEQRQQKQISTKVLAQRIIGSAFNFLASFAESDPSNRGHEVVSLKSFRDWWTKFERRVEVDPAFLEREDPNAT
ncbi:hypothetical protein N7510_003979 [Penicillium lagena]|uniref:uncharacterized protein n=1 Tax=Penicillium lagena TaxID=94218 RepID=UPI00253FD321|nr:uncharacterized protein N7510_003979 [Penicillium lagena]KAJ5619995.1 hypothetical protein N7510_003979 [Penicillium lagena]